MTTHITIKHILTSNHNWWNFYNQYKNRIREAIVTCIVKLLSCKETIRGYREYTCSNPSCTHVKKIPFTCKSKACSSCGKKATELWIQKQNQILPKTSWQHITFTIPSELWDFFWCNRHLLNMMGNIAAQCIKAFANKKGAIPGIFIAIHTFGRDLKRNVHIHLSTTLGGLSTDRTRWIKLFFHQATLMRMWRYQIIKLFRQSPRLNIPPEIQKQLNHTFTFNHFLESLYKKTWVVHCCKPSHDYQKIIGYLGGYVKRPPIAESKLKHYDGHDVTFKYLDHHSKTYRYFKCSADDFIARFIQHIPDKGFRMIRYYGFLAHRIRGKLLPLVYSLLNQKISTPTPPPFYSELTQKHFNFNPLICILCGHQLIPASIHIGAANIQTLLLFHRELALLQKI